MMHYGPALAVLLLAGCVSVQPDESAPSPQTVLHPQAIEMETSAGNLTILLYPEAAPKTVALMLQYIDEGYYSGRAFGRIVPGHVIQVTDSTPDGSTEDARRVPLETNRSYHFAAGALGIARGADPGSGGPEFFIMDFATSHLDGNYTVWGQVVQGLDVVHTIARGPGLDAPALPGPLDGSFPFDRMALPAVTIESARLVESSVPVKDRPDYPLQVARNLRVGNLRHSLEWPNAMRPGQESDFTWYIRPYGKEPVPDASGLQVKLGAQQITVVGEATQGIYHFNWTPPASGPFNATLLQSGAALATLQVQVA